ncbi:MAG: efflux RND transporter periplasmic adaptor subunit [Gammaproteobacteria bacterium]
MSSVRMSRRAWWITGVMAVAIIAGLILWLVPWGGEASGYETAPVQYGDITQTVTSSGTLNPVKIVNVGAQVSGIVKTINVDFNSRVKAGEVLLTLDPTLFKTQVGQSRANLHAAEANQLLALANQQRSQEMFRQHYVSRSDLDQVIAERKAADAQVELAKAQLEQSETNLAYTVIHSPIDGVIINRVVDVGQTVAASFQTPTLFQIGQDLKKMQIDATVDEADIGMIKTGEEASFTVDAYPGIHFAGIVTQVRLNPTVVQNVVTYDVVIAVDNPDERLLPGMTAYVGIAVNRHEHVLVVPNSALRVSLEPVGSTAPVEGPDRGVVYVLTPDGPKLTQVTVGISDNRRTEISGNGVKAGDQVVVGLARVDKVRNSRSMLQAH